MQCSNDYLLHYWQIILNSILDIHENITGKVIYESSSNDHEIKYNQTIPYSTTSFGLCTQTHNMLQKDGWSSVDFYAMSSY